MSGGIEETYNLKNLRRSLTMNRSYISTQNSSIQASNEQEVITDHTAFWEILINARKKQSVIGSNIEVSTLYLVSTPSLWKNIFLIDFTSHFFE